MNQEQLKKLRAESRFEEGYKLTKEALAQKENDIWARRNHSWSIYYMLKKCVQGGQTAQAKHFLAEFGALHMSTDEKLLHERMEYFYKVLNEGYLEVKQLIADGRYQEAFQVEVTKSSPDSEQLAWIGYYILKSFNKTGNPSAFETFEVIAKLIADFVPSKKLVNKLLLGELIKTPSEFWTTAKQSDFLEKVGLFEVMEEDDYQKQEWEGKKIISLAERLHIAYSKALIRERASSEKIQAYIREVVEPILEQFPAMLYVPYFKAKLLLGMGDKEMGLKAFLPFAKKKSGEFWVWQVFAEAYEEKPELYFSCLCKAMTCKTKPEFLSNIQEKLIAYLVNTSQYSYAKSELERLLQLRQSHKWGVKAIHIHYLEADWYRHNRPENLHYEKHVSLAEDLLGGFSKQSIEVIIHHINKEKKLCSFLIAEGKTGFGKYTSEPELFGLYKLHGAEGDGDFFQIKMMEKVSNREHVLLREVKGQVIKKEQQGFAFVSGAFVEPGLVKKFGLVDGMHVAGEALLAPVKGKEQWSWKLVHVHSFENKKG